MALKDRWDALSPKEWENLATMLDMDLEALGQLEAPELLRRTYWALSRREVNARRQRMGLEPLKLTEGR